ncbi:MAG: mismatch-specific DNA-glycosylase [Gammaproteobacteria bacterium]|nr:mismatch-specific DNA-glycosylase [Gammaproteobacteria bacterium]
MPKTPPPADNAELQPLPDFLEGALDIVTIGVNPSIASARAGFYYANPRNRFWPALNASTLVDEELAPGIDSIARLAGRHGIGFTDIVKRPTPMEKDLPVAELRAGAEILRDKLLAVRPAILWFNGKTPHDRLMRLLGLEKAAGWGEQPQRWEGMRCFVAPNPSPANAAFSLDELVGWYDRLAALRAALRDGSTA